MHSTLPFVTLEELNSQLPSQALVVAALGKKGLRLATPNDRFQVDERVFVLCAPGEINEVLELAGSDSYHVKHVLLIGGGEVGFQVARALQRLRFDVTVIEKDHQRAETVAAGLRKSIVIHGDGTDPATISEQIRQGQEAVVVLVDDDSQSLLAGIVAKDLGAKKVIARVGNQEYGPIARKLGVDALISPRRAVADAILHFIRRSHITSTVMLGNHQGELIDFHIDSRSKSKLTQVPISSLDVPKNCLIGVITRGENVIVPRQGDDTRIRPGDHVFVVALRDAVAELDQLFG
jgi:trk system potassium uptake protein TrkA